MLTRREGNHGRVTSYLELMNWMLRRLVDEASVAALVKIQKFVVQRDGEDDLSFAERLQILKFECEFMYGEGALKGLFLGGVHSVVRDTFREESTPGMKMAELVGVVQTNGDAHRWLRNEHRKARPRSERCSRKRRGSGGKLAWPHPREYRRGLGPSGRATPPFGSSGKWTPRLSSSGQ